MWFLLALSLAMAQAVPPDACSLLSPAAIKQAIGADAEAGKAGTPYFAGNTNCEFKIGPRAVVSIIATTGPNQPGYFGPRGDADQRFKGAVALDGIGDRGFIWPASAADATLTFLKGTTQIDLRVSGLGRTLTPAQLTALARAVLGRLP